MSSGESLLNSLQQLNLSTSSLTDERLKRTNDPLFTAPPGLYINFFYKLHTISTRVKEYGGFRRYPTNLSPTDSKPSSLNIPDIACNNNQPVRHSSGRDVRIHHRKLLTRSFSLTLQQTYFRYIGITTPLPAPDELPVYTPRPGHTFSGWQCWANAGCLEEPFRAR